MLLTVAQTLNKIWTFVRPYFIGVSLGGITSALFYCLFKFSVNKALKKIDDKKLVDKAVNGAKEEVKKTTFEVNIQPIVLSEVKKVCEEIKEDANTKLIASNEKTNEKLEKLENVVVALGNYFDDSIGVSEEKKKAFHKAVEELNTENEVPNVVVIEQLEVAPTEIKEDKAPKKQETIER